LSIGETLIFRRKRPYSQGLFAQVVTSRGRSTAYVPVIRLHGLVALLSRTYHPFTDRVFDQLGRAMDTELFYGFSDDFGPVLQWASPLPNYGYWSTGVRLKCKHGAHDF